MRSTCFTIILAMFLVSAALVLSPAVCAGVEIAHANYFPTHDLDRKLYKTIAQLLNGDTRPVGLNPKELFEEFAKLRHEAIGSYEQVVHKGMYEIGSTGQDGCNTLLPLQLVYLIVSIAEQHQSNVPALANWMNYLRIFGKQKFTECATDIVQNFEARISAGRRAVTWPKRPSSYEKALDKFIAVAYKLDTFDDVKLYELAKKVDLTKDSVSVRRMIDVANLYFGPSLIEKKRASGMQVLRAFIRDACFVLQADFDIDFGTYNIAIALGSQLPRNIPVRFLKLNEYNRICIAWKEDGKADENLLEQLQAEGAKWYKFGKN